MFSLGSFLKSTWYIWVIIGLLMYTLVLRAENANLRTENIANTLAIKAAQQAYEDAVKRQQAIDKVTTMFRVEQYKNIEAIRNIDASKLSCDEAVEKFMPYVLHT